MSPYRASGPAPREVRLGQRTLIALYVFVGGMLALALLAEVTSSTGRSPPGCFALFVGLLALALVWLGNAWLSKSRIVLDGDVLTLHLLGFGRQSVRRSDVRGRRALAPIGGGVVLELRSGAQPFGMDGVWANLPEVEAWLAGLPDLDAEDRARIEARIRADSSFGPTEADRARALVRALRIGRTLTAATVLTVIWGVVLPRPYALVVAILVLLPFVAAGVALSRRGLYVLASGPADPRPAICAPLTLPMFVVIGRGFLEVDFLELAPLVLPALIAGPLLGIAVSRFEVERDRRRFTAGVLAVALTLHVSGSIALADRVLDATEPERFRTKVVDEHDIRTRNRTMHVRLVPWGPVTEEREYHVRGRACAQLEVGDAACIDLHQGALGARWYAIEPCDRRAPRPRATSHGSE